MFVYRVEIKSRDSFIYFEWIELSLLYHKPIFREMFLTDRVKETQWCIRKPIQKLQPFKVRQLVNFD